MTEKDRIIYKLKKCKADSYGIVVYQGENIIAAAENISSDINCVKRLSEIFNAYSLDPIHFDQAIDDFLTDLRLPE